MGFGLRAINRFAGHPLVEKLRLRKPAERALFHGSRIGFRSAGAVARSFQSTLKLVKPERLTRSGSASLFDLTPTDEQQMLCEAVQGFALEQMRPAGLAADTDCAASEAVLRGAA
jgi:hypothetical protein